MCVEPTEVNKAQSTAKVTQRTKSSTAIRPSNRQEHGPSRNINATLLGCRSGLDFGRSWHFPAFVNMAGTSNLSCDDLIDLPEMPSGSGSGAGPRLPSTSTGLHLGFILIRSAIPPSIDQEIDSSGFFTTFQLDVMASR
jgi:hypothetical protein